MSLNSKFISLLSVGLAAGLFKGSLKKNLAVAWFVIIRVVTEVLFGNEKISVTFTQEQLNTWGAQILQQKVLKI